MSENAVPWLVLPQAADDGTGRSVFLLPYSFRHCIDLIGQIQSLRAGDQRVEHPDGARRLSAGDWDVLAARWDWLPGGLPDSHIRVVDQPPSLSVGAPVQARETMNAFWVHYGFGAIPRTETSPLNLDGIATLAFGLARTPAELAELLGLHDARDARFLADVLTGPSDNQAHERWARAALDQRWPGGLPEAALTELLNASDRSVREFAIRHLPDSRRTR